MLLDVGLAPIFLFYDLPFFPTRRTARKLLLLSLAGKSQIVGKQGGWSGRNLTNIDSFSGLSNIKLEIEKKHSQKEVSLFFPQHAHRKCCMYMMYVHICIC